MSRDLRGGSDGSSSAPCSWPSSSFHVAVMMHGPGKVTDEQEKQMEQPQFLQELE